MRYYKSEYERPPWQFIILLFLIMFVIWFVTSCNSSNTYNNGICRECGGHYVFQNAVGHKYETNYIYVCDTCGKLIEINQYYNSN